MRVLLQTSIVWALLRYKVERVVLLDSDRQVSTHPLVLGAFFLATPCIWPCTEHESVLCLDPCMRLGWRVSEKKVRPEFPFLPRVSVCESSKAKYETKLFANTSNRF